MLRTLRGKRTPREGQDRYLPPSRCGPATQPQLPNQLPALRGSVEGRESACRSRTVGDPSHLKVTMEAHHEQIGGRTNETTIDDLDAHYSGSSGNYLCCFDGSVPGVRRGSHADIGGRLFRRCTP